MRRVIAVSLVAVALVAGCRPDRVDLAYEWDAGQQIAYRMTATATASWEIGSPGSGSYRVEFDVVERVLSTNVDGAVVEVTMTPIEVEEHGMPSPGAGERAFSLQLDRRGEVLDVIEVDGVAAADLAPDQLAFVGSYRPPLPSRPVGLRDEWTSDGTEATAHPATDFVTTGTLTRFGREDDADVAQIDLTGRGPLDWEAELAQGRANLAGDVTTRTMASLRVSDGALREAITETRGEFLVTIAGGARDERGRLQLDLEVVVRRR